MLSAQLHAGHTREETRLNLHHPESPSPVRGPGPVSYSFNISETSRVPSLGPETGENVEQDEVPVLGEFVVQVCERA